MLDSTHRRLPPTSLNLAPARAKYVPRTYNRFPAPARPQTLYGCHDGSRRPRTPGRGASSLSSWSPVTHARGIERITSHPVLLRGCATTAVGGQGKSTISHEGSTDLMAALMGVALPQDQPADHEAPPSGREAASPPTSPALSPLLESQPLNHDLALKLAPISPTQLILDASPSSSCYSRPSAPNSGGGDLGTALQSANRSPSKQLLFSPPPLSASFVVVQSLTPFLVWTPAPGATQQQQEQQRARPGSAKLAVASAGWASMGTFAELMSPSLVGSAREEVGLEALLSPAEGRGKQGPPQSPLTRSRLGRPLCSSRSAAPLTGRLQASLLDVLDEGEELDGDVKNLPSPSERPVQRRVGEDVDNQHAVEEEQKQSCDEEAEEVDGSIITFPCSSPAPWWHDDAQLDQHRSGDAPPRQWSAALPVEVEAEGSGLLDNAVSLVFFSGEDLM